MDIFFAIFTVLVIITIFIPLLIAERWMERQEKARPRPRPGKKRKRYIKKTKTTSNFTPLFESIVNMQARIAKSDGVISAAEAEYIKNTITHFISMAKQDGLNDSKLFKLRQRLVQAHEKAKDNRIPISTYAKKLRSQKYYIKEQILQQLIYIATIDGYTQLKESLIFNAGTAMGISSLQIRKCIDSILETKQEKEPSKDSSLYMILGCRSTDSNATIKKRYRELVKKYHPDFMHSKGASGADVEFAKQKMQEINLAYEKIKKERGM